MSINKKTTKAKSGRKSIESPLKGEIGELYFRGLIPGGFCCVDIAREKEIFTSKTILSKKEPKDINKEHLHIVKKVEIPDGSRYTRLVNNKRFKKYFKKEDRIVKGKRRTYYITKDLKLIVDHIEKILKERDHSLDSKEKKQLLDVLDSNAFRGLIDLKEAQEYTSSLDYFCFGIGFFGLVASYKQEIDEAQQPLTKNMKKLTEELGGSEMAHRLFYSVSRSLNEKLGFLLPTSTRESLVQLKLLMMAFAYYSKRDVDSFNKKELDKYIEDLKSLG